MTNRADTLLVTFQDGIKRITINRPERRNSVDLETVSIKTHVAFARPT